MQHQTSQIEGGIGVAGDLLERVQIPADSEIFKDPEIAAAAGSSAPAMISANGEVDLGNLDLSQMDPEVIRVTKLLSLILPTTKLSLTILIQERYSFIT